MKLRVFKYVLKISRRFKSAKAIIPIGCDCHPAYMLNKAKLRKESLPFDWLDTEPRLALQYAFENIRDGFEFFTGNLEKNENGKVYANKYPEALFYHFDDLNTNHILQEKINLRINKLLNVIKSKPCYFIHNTKSNAFKTEGHVKDFVRSITNFITLLKPQDELLIYLRYDETLDENKLNCELLLSLVEPLESCKITPYIRYEKENGIWGDETKYNALIKSLGINLKNKFPEIELLKE